MRAWPLLVDLRHQLACGVDFIPSRRAWTSTYCSWPWKDARVVEAGVQRTVLEGLEPSLEDTIEYLYFSLV